MPKEKPVVDESSLPVVVADFLKYKVEADRLKPIVDGLNKTIKGIMGRMGLSEFVLGDKKVTLTTQRKESFEEGKLVEFLKTKDIPGIIKTREYVDMDVLENAIYNETLGAAELAPFTVVNEVVVLRVGIAQAGDLEV